MVFLFKVDFKVFRVKDESSCSFVFNASGHRIPSVDPVHAPTKCRYGFGDSSVAAIIDAFSTAIY